MAERLVFLIDNDPHLSAEIAATLQGYGLQVVSFSDGNEALAAKDVPQLIILSIDPKRLGWGVCNRMKKSPQLKSVPLLVTSAEATEKDFEDHKQLKNRAEDYVRKPFTIDHLVERVALLVGGLEMAPEDAVEIPIGDDLGMEEVGEVLPSEFGEDFGGDPTGVVNASDFLVDKETDDAFESIGADGGELEQPLPGMAPVPADPPHLAAAHPAPAAAAVAATPAPEPDLDPLGLDEMAAKVEESSRSERLPGPEGELVRMREQVERLQKELDEARAKPVATGGTFSRDREFLGLREVINKKEKEVLDLKDQVDAKDRQLLDTKDKMRELDRARRDLDEKLLAIEHELVAAREQNEALGRDKEMAQTREKQLKGRLDDAQKKIEKAHIELDELNGKAAASDAQAKSAVEQAAGERAKLEQRIAELERQHEQDLASLKRAHDESQAQLVARHEGQLAEAQQREQAQLAEAAEQHEQRLQQATAAHAQALQGRERSHGEALQALSDEHAAALAEAEARHRQDLITADRVRTEELARKDAEHQQTLRALDEQRTTELTAARSAAEADRARMEAEHGGVVEGLKRDHAQQVSEHLEAHAAELDQVRGAAGAQAARASQLEGELAEARRRLAEMEETLHEASAQAATLAGELATARSDSEKRAAKVAELEAETAKLQEQVLAAWQRVRNDETIVTRARKALAIALTLLDESAADGRGEGAARKSS